MIATTKRPEADTPPRGHQTILCVDDEPLVSRSLYRLLSREPYDVLIADTPQQALRYVRDYPIDLVITDQRMPDMSGVELLSEVRQVSPRTSGLILTAYPESVLVDDLPEAPPPPIFAKPWDDATLRESIRELLGVRSPEQAEKQGTPRRSRFADKRQREGSESIPSRKAKADPGVRTVLVPVDGSIEPELTLNSVLPLLKSDPIRLVLLEVLFDLGLHRDVYARLERARLRLASEGVDAIADVRWGDPVKQILLHARHADADLIVLSNAAKRGPLRLFRRSLAEKVLDEAEIPLLVGRPEVLVRSWKKILVPLDGSREAEAGLSEAVRLAKKTGASIDVMGVTPIATLVGYGYIPYWPRMQDRMPYLSEIVKYIEFEDVPANACLLEGEPAREILRHAEESGTDLICMATRGNTPWGRFINGSVTSEVLRSAPCPVFVRRTPWL